MGIVAGYLDPTLLYSSVEEAVSPPPVEVHIYYAPKNSEGCKPKSNKSPPPGHPIETHKIWDCVKKKVVTAKPDGYFRFDGVPIGTERYLLMTMKEEYGKAMHYRIAIEPGTMWLGILGAIP